MQRFHLEILSDAQKEVLKTLAHFGAHGILGGGTALTLQLKHRKSYDFDLFYSSEIQESLFLAINKRFEHISIIVNTLDELSFITQSGVKVSFISYPFAPLFDAIEQEGMRFFSWRDIALDKAYTIGRRSEWRDYIDLYAVIKNGFALADIVSNAKKKFGRVFSEKLFLSQLYYSSDLKDFSVEFINEEITPGDLKSFFEQEIKRITR